MTESWHADEHLPVIARFEVRHRVYLAPDGSINHQLPAFASDTRLLVRLYRAMVLVRAFEASFSVCTRRSCALRRLSSDSESSLVRSWLAQTIHSLSGKVLQ